MVTSFSPDLLEKRFAQCVAALRREGADRLPPGALLYLLRHLEENVLRPLTGDAGTREYTWGGSTYTRDPRASVARAYDELAAVYEELVEGRFDWEEEVVLPEIGDVAGLDVLDLGCGTGRYARRFAAAGARVIGVDVSPEMLKVARQATDRKGLPVQWRCGDVLEMDLPEEGLDLAFSALALAHVMDLEALLARLRRALRPGGRIVLTDIHPSAARAGILAGLPCQDRFLVIPRRIHDISRIVAASRSAGLRLEQLLEWPADWTLPMFLLVTLQPAPLPGATGAAGT